MMSSCRGMGRVHTIIRDWNYVDSEQPSYQHGSPEDTWQIRLKPVKRLRPLDRDTRRTQRTEFAYAAFTFASAAYRASMQIDRH